MSAGIGRAVEPVDVFDAKADAFALLEALGMPLAACRSSPAARPGSIPAARRSCSSARRSCSAAFGELHPRTLELLDVEGPVVGLRDHARSLARAEVEGDRARAKLALSELQPVRRDFAFVVDRKVARRRHRRTVQGGDTELIAERVVFDVYEGAGIAEGQKSVAVEVTCSRGTNVNRCRDRGGRQQDRRRGLSPTEQRSRS